MKRPDGPISLFAQRLTQLRRLSNMTQREVSQHLQMERSTYAYYESGATTPGFDTLRRISSLYHVPVDYLLGGEFSPSPDQVHQSDESPFPQFEGALLLGSCNQEERSFLALFRSLDLDAKQKLLAYCLELSKEADKK